MIQPCSIGMKEGDNICKSFGNQYSTDKNSNSSWISALLKALLLEKILHWRGKSILACEKPSENILNEVWHSRESSQLWTSNCPGKGIPIPDLLQITDHQKSFVTVNKKGRIKMRNLRTLQKAIEGQNTHTKKMFRAKLQRYQNTVLIYVL